MLKAMPFANSPSSAASNLMNLSKIVVPVILAVVALMFVAPNMSNFRVPAGYAGYVYSVPIFGKSSFKEVLIGPASTGWRWRLAGQLVSVTPYTYPETFSGQASALAKDKLSLDANSHIVWRLKSDPQEIRRFLESFGGWDSAATPDDVAQEAYDQYIKEPFRTETRTIIANYDGLDVNAELTKISGAIKGQVVQRLADTPFEVLDVVMGNAQPPANVIEAISKKVASNQELEQRAIQLQIAQKNIEIDRAEGEAAGARVAAQAEEEAKAINSIKAVLSPEYIQYLGMQNIKGADRVIVPAGSNVFIGTPEKGGGKRAE
jgi:regulator of protease activity HflC (stomatin/prohibitin superfamily)